MGWVSSPPFFCAATETAADIANHHLHVPHWHPTRHGLSQIADNPTNFIPVTRYIPRRQHLLSLTPPSKALATLPPVITTMPPPVSVPVTMPPPVPITMQPPAPLVAISLDHHTSISARQRRHLSYHQPHQVSCPTTPVAYVDLYMDDFLGLAQGHPGLRERVRSTLFHSIDNVFRPLQASDRTSSRRQPISISKLHKGDAKWSTRKCLLGWVIDTVTETIELPEHRQFASWTYSTR